MGTPCLTLSAGFRLAISYVSISVAILLLCWVKFLNCHVVHASSVTTCSLLPSEISDQFDANSKLVGIFTCNFGGADLVGCVGEL